MSEITCNTGKTVFVDKKAAYSRAKQINQENNYSTRMRAYCCPYCEYWHLTSMEKTKYNKIKRSKERKKRNQLNIEAEYWKNKLGV